MGRKKKKKQNRKKEQEISQIDFREKKKQVRQILSE